jgi:hypothetical protein
MMKERVMIERSDDRGQSWQMISDIPTKNTISLWYDGDAADAAI